MDKKVILGDKTLNELGLQYVIESVRRESPIVSAVADGDTLFALVVASALLIIGDNLTRRKEGKEMLQAAFLVDAATGERIGVGTMIDRVIQVTGAASGSNRIRAAAEWLVSECESSGELRFVLFDGGGGVVC
jgi:hypothetical protein